MKTRELYSIITKTKGDWRKNQAVTKFYLFIQNSLAVPIVVLDMPLLDTRQNRDLTGTLIADIVLQLLSYVAQTEREFIKQRQKEGIAAAKARGVKFGRAPLERPAEFDQLQSLWLQGEVSAREAGRQLNVTHKTFLRWVQTENFG